MSNGNSYALPVALGAGGGLLLWYLLRDKHDASGAAQTSTTTATAIAEHQAPTATARACALRLDATGLTADGARVGVADAVKRCKSAGAAEVTIIPNASAAAYAEVMIALGRAGIPTHSHRNTRSGGTRHDARRPRVGDQVHLADHVRMVPAHDGRPPVLRDTLLRVASIHGRGTKGSPHTLEVTDGTHTWSFDPDDLVAVTRGASGQTYRRFTLRTYPDGHHGVATSRWFRADPPATWVDARDRLIAAGIVDPALAGRTHARGGWMLSIDPRDYHDQRAEPLPGEAEGPRNESPASTFILVVYPRGDEGPKRVRYYRADPPTSWEDARDRLARAGVIDREMFRRTRYPGGWLMVTEPRFFDADEAEPLPDDIASARNESPPASTFTLSLYPDGDAGSRRIRYYLADAPLSWEQARDRLAQAGVIDPEKANRTRAPGGWVLATHPRVFQSDQAEPLPGGNDGA